MSSALQLQKVLANSRTHSDALFSLIKPESLYQRPIPERHRIIFYFGHLEAFDWNQICRWTLDKPSFHPEFDQLFEAGIDPHAGDLPQDQPSDWPPVKEIQHYNTRIRREIDEALEDTPERMIHVALEHRWMHVETTAYILQHISPEGKRHQAPKQVMPSPPPTHRMIEIPAGTTIMGRNQEEGFGWDNEFTKQDISVPAFTMSKYKVTNRQYLAFVEDGASPPPFWSKVGNQWFLKTMFEVIPLQHDWPVYVSQREAQAYATWAGMALPTEAQFHRAAYSTPKHEGILPYPWGHAAPTPERGNFNFYHWDPIPVTATPLGDSAFGLSQLVGNGWEWTSTIFHPFEGFHPIPTYPGYSSRFFDQDHYVVKGGAPQTAACLLRRSFRNWFRQSYPHAHAGFRCVQN
ncbi:MAG: SUMF1/EgtB/PvdO family nonheme iron enzyme [Nitrospirales bacterium]|nr:SUMF1/EgtB/PvdO family nonheme iron enzyme [Nitrospirales bacterium]